MVSQAQNKITGEIVALKVIPLEENDALDVRGLLRAYHRDETKADNITSGVHP
jgi:hypothetical protein